MENGRIDVEASAVLGWVHHQRECDTSGWVQSKICKYKRKQIITKHYITILLEGSNKELESQKIADMLKSEPILQVAGNSAALGRCIQNWTDPSAT